MLVKHMIRSGILLGLFAIIGTGIVAYTYSETRDDIAASQRAALLRSLHELVPDKRYDNNLASDTIQVTDKVMLGSAKPLTVYRARRDGKPVAAVFEAIAPDGYNGNIYLLIAINYNGTIAGVRVVSESETPGLGDAVETDRSDWIYGFTGRSLDNPTPANWKVKRDGGVFDQFTGATITPRAVVKAVYHCLEYFKTNRDKLFIKQHKAAS
jgi:electron transport complex protein RnfG